MELKLRSLGSVVVAVGLAFANGNVLAQEHTSAGHDGRHVDQVVYPTGIFPGDVVNVQTALGLGGSILLKATDASGTPTAFNLGPAAEAGGTVFLTTDVTLRGETLDEHMTTIAGGNFPVVGFKPIRSRIHGIHFERPRGVAIYLTASLGTRLHKTE